jgi:hypothetical protein
MTRFEWQKLKAAEVNAMTDDCREDTSNWVIHPIHRRAMERLQWMLWDPKGGMQA